MWECEFGKDGRVCLAVGMGIEAIGTSKDFKNKEGKNTNSFVRIKE